MNSRPEQEAQQPATRRNRPPISVPSSDATGRSADRVSVGKSRSQQKHSADAPGATSPEPVVSPDPMAKAPATAEDVNPLTKVPDSSSASDDAAAFAETSSSQVRPTTNRDQKAAFKAGAPELPKQPGWLVVVLGLLGSCLYFAALGPFNLGQVGFLAIAPWAWLVVDGRLLKATGYANLFLCGVVLWGLLYATEVGAALESFLKTLPLICYLAVYIPLFVFLGRIGRRRLNLPSYLWLPVVWCALEWLRSSLFGGFGLGMLGHAAVDSRRVLQITDLAGSYGLGMLMVASGASVAELIWLTIRLRRLERAMPKQGDASGDEDSPAFTSTGRISVIGADRDRYVRGSRKSRARESLEAAMRRNRDHTRDYHITLATMSVLVVAGVLVFSNWYGADRMQETRSWKLFESNLYELTVLAGPDVEERLEEELHNGDEGLLVAAADRPIEPNDLKSTLLAARNFLLINPNAGAEPHDSRWVAQITLRNGNQQQLPLDTSGNDKETLSRIWRERVAPARAFKPDPDEMPIRLMPALTNSVSIEQAVNETLRSFHERGRAIDAVVLTLDPETWEGMISWPRLVSRSVMAAAVANRCPVVAMVPSGFVSIATGDGKLWWTYDASENPEGAGAIPGDREGAGKRAGGSLRVISMIDPRSSLFVKLGDAPALACALICLLVVIGYGAELVRKHLARGQVRHA